jgi:hypothetical protein
MPGLQPEEGDRSDGADRGAADLPGYAVDAARQVDRQHRRSRFVDPSDDIARIAFQVAGEAGSKQSVEHEVPGKIRRGSKCLHGAAPRIRRPRRVAAPRAAGEPPDAYIEAEFPQERRRRQRVAAIVARPRERQDAPPRDHRRPSRRHGSCGVLHQPPPWRPACDGEAIRLRHLARRQHLRMVDHEQNLGV